MSVAVGERVNATLRRSAKEIGEGGGPETLSNTSRIKPRPLLSALAMHPEA